MLDRPLKVAWISSFPIEWLPDIPEPMRNLPRLHPATWQRVLLDEFQKRSDLKLHIISVRKHFPRDYRFESGGATFHCLKIPPGLRTLTLFWWETALIRRCLKEIQPDLVHAWGCERGAALVASRLRYPYLVTMQGLLQWYGQQVKLSGINRFEAFLEPISLRRASTATTESKFSVNWLRSRYPHLEVHQVEHAPAWLFHRIQRQPKTQPLEFLFVGLLSERKGTDLLLKALDRLRAEIDFRLTLVGSSEPQFLERMRPLTSGALRERVRLRENLLPSQIGEELSSTTMLIFPSRADTSPNAVKEAVVAGVPVLASNVGGIPDYVLHGRNGLIFTAGNLDALLAALRAAVAHPVFSKGMVDPGALHDMRDYLSPRRMDELFFKTYGSVSKKSLRARPDLAALKIPDRSSNH